MAEWEYKTIEVETNGLFLGGLLNILAFDAKMNELGKEGWELVAAFDANATDGRSHEAVVIFKRPRNHSEDRPVSGPQV